MKENRGKQYKHNSRTQNSQKVLIRRANRQMDLTKANSSYDGLISLMMVLWWSYDGIGLQRRLNVKETACQCRRHGLNSWVRKIPWRRKWPPISIFLPGKSHGQRSLLAYSPQGCKSQAQLSGWAWAQGWNQTWITKQNLSRLLFLGY